MKLKTRLGNRQRGLWFVFVVVFEFHKFGMSTWKAQADI
jgi:hypothetical protein